MSYAYDKVIKIMGKKKKGRKVDVSDEIQIWRNEWKERGPVEFAENVLICPPDVPPHPELGRVPEFVILTNDQKEFLIDLWKGKVQYIILAAGRGSGKTFVFAIYTTWRLCCFDYFTMTVMGGCYDTETEVLTNNGWKYFKDTTNDDTICTLNPDTNEIEYQLPTNTISYHHKGKMYYISSEQVNQLVTPEHNLFVKLPRSNKYRLEKAQRSYNKQRIYKKNGIWNGNEKEFFTLESVTRKRGFYTELLQTKYIPMNEWLKFLGLWLAEGWSTLQKVKGGHRYRIALRNNDNNLTQEIYELLSKWGFNPFKYDNNTVIGVDNKQLFEYLRPLGKSYEKHIPREFMNLSSRQLKILLNYYIKGDGNIETGEDRTVPRKRAWTVSKKLKDDLQELALKVGISANFYNRGKKTGIYKGRTISSNYDVYQISFIEKANEPTVNPYRKTKKKNIFTKEIDYNGMVYCVTVPNHVIYVRRGGKPVWSGNSSEQSEKIKEYIDFWRRRDKNIFYALYKSIGGGNKAARVTSRWDAFARFPACSIAGARGPHVTQLLIDEVCLHPDSLLIGKYGTVDKSINYNVGDLLLSHDGKYHKITKKFEREIDEELIEIKPYYFPIGLKITKNHPLYGDKRKGEQYYFEKEDRYMPPTILKSDIALHWIEANNLKVNDFLSFPIPKRNIENINKIDISGYLKKKTWNNIVDITINEDFCELLGWYIAEGSTNKDRVFFSVNEGEEEYVANLIRNVFNKEPQFHHFKSNNCVNVFFSSRSIVRWLKEKCGHRAPNKHIPYEFMNLPRNKINKIIKGVLAGDAYEDNDKFRLHITSLNLGMQLVYLRAEEKKFTSIQDCQFGYEFIGYNNNKYGFIKDGYMIVPIREINKFHYKGKVYNFAVEDTETYCSPFSILHNCVGESRGKDGAQAILDATYQLTSSPNQLLGYSSTAQFILGKFYDVWTHYKELGFKRYRWPLAYHISNMWFTVDRGGKKVANWTYIDDVLYKDRNPKHWKSNVWWVTQRDIEAFRKNSTDDQWLVEILGGISRGSGLVFSREDLAHCICDGHLYTKDKTTCKVCEPYTENCPMAKFYDLNLAKISERRGGVDFGEVSPNAMTVSGKRGNTVFVLYNDERVDGTEEILKWVEETAKKYKLFFVFADPEERAMRETLELRGFNVPHIWGGSGGQMKSYYVTNTKRFVEQHRVVIPIKFNYLVDSISALAYDDRGNVRKHNDHSWDSWMYSMIDYNIDDLLGDGFYGKIKRGEREIRKIW